MGNSYRVPYYKDTGCDIHPACLTCPLPRCRYDLPPKTALAIVQAMKLRELVARGETVARAASILGISRRSAFRAVKLLRQMGIAVVYTNPRSRSGTRLMRSPNLPWPDDNDR